MLKNANKTIARTEAESKRFSLGFEKNRKVEEKTEVKKRTKKAIKLMTDSGGTRLTKTRKKDQEVKVEK